MAKQKSGLGKGLGALFNDASSYASNENRSTEAEESKQKVAKQAVSTEKEVTPSVTEPSAPEMQTEETATKPSADIYISEDAIEHAKVVERAARPVANSSAVKKPHLPSVQLLLLLARRVIKISLQRARLRLKAYRRRVQVRLKRTIRLNRLLWLLPRNL